MVAEKNNFSVSGAPDDTVRFVEHKHWHHFIRASMIQWSVSKLQSSPNSLKDQITAFDPTEMQFTFLTSYM
jgi:hypothetical protein